MYSDMIKHLKEMRGGASGYKGKKGKEEKKDPAKTKKRSKGIKRKIRGRERGYSTTHRVSWLDFFLL